MATETFDNGQSKFVNVTGALQVISDPEIPSNFIGNCIASASGLRCILDPVIQNGAVESRIKLISTEDSADMTIGLMIRYTDINNYYLFIYENGNFMITKKVAGSITELASAPGQLTLNKWYSFRAVFNGSSLVFKVNNTPTVSATDGTFTSGKAGLVAFRTTSHIDNFVVQSETTPQTAKITGFSPSSGAIGTLVQIQGTNLMSCTSVLFGGVKAIPSAVSDTQISVIVPAGAKSGPIKITVGSAIISSSATFTIQGSPPTSADPYITSFTPSNGQIGDLITIQGANLEYTSNVSFNGILSTPIKITETSIQVKVPQGATSGKVIVTSYAKSKNMFAVDSTTPPSTIPEVTGFSPNSGPVGTSITITGKNLNLITSVKIGGLNTTYTGNSTLITAKVPNLGSGSHEIIISAQTPVSVGYFNIMTSPPSTEGKILYHFNASKGQGILELENDQGTSWAYRIENDPIEKTPAYRFECRAATKVSDSQRSELKIYRGDWHATMNGEYWYGIKMMLDPSWKLSGDRWCVLTQWHDIPDGIDSKQLEEWRHPVLAICAINDKWKITYRCDDDKISNTSNWGVFDRKTLGNPQNPYGWQGDIDKDEPNWHAFPLANDVGKWTKWVIHTKWSYQNDAILEIWKDGQKLISQPHHPIMYNDDLGPSSKFGIYRSAPASFAPYQDRIFWYKDYIVGEKDCSYEQISKLLS